MVEHTADVLVSVQKPLALMHSPAYELAMVSIAPTLFMPLLGRTLIFGYRVWRTVQQGQYWCGAKSLQELKSAAESAVFCVHVVLRLTDLKQPLCREEVDW